MTGARHLHPATLGRVVAVVGPTAAGKTSLSLDLAAALDGEVINADSMQLYRGMDIGTAKLPPHERRGIPHHALDLWDVTEPVLAPVRRVLPPFGGLDFSPLVVIVLLQLLGSFLRSSGA